MSNKIGGMFVEVGAKIDKLKDGMSEVKKSVDKTAEDTKSKFKEVEKSTDSMGNKFKEFGKVIAEVFAIRAIASFTAEAIKLAAETRDLQNAFKGTTRDIELFKKATADTVDDGDLLKLSNLALSLGISIEKQPQLFLLATNAVRDYGGTIQEKFEGIIRVSEGMVRGVGQLGIEKGAYLQKVKELAAAEGDTIANLDAEIQKRIRLQAVLELSGVTMDDVKNRQQTLNEQIKGVPVLVEGMKEAFGNMFASVLTRMPILLNFMKDLKRRMEEIANGGEFENAGKNATKYDFSGTSEEDRKKLISQWEQANKELQAAHNNREIANSDVEDAVRTLKTQIAANNELIRQAKEIKGVSGPLYGPETKPEVIGGPKKEKERVTSAIEELKFLSKDYWDFRVKQINDLAAQRLKDGQTEINVEMAKNESLKKLAQELYDYREKLYPSLNGVTGAKGEGIGTPGSLPFDTVKGSDVKPFAENTTAMRLQIELTDTWRDGLDSAGNSLANSLGQSVQVFSQANSLLQQFINNLASAVTQMLAMKAIGYALSFIGGGGASMAAHSGGNFVGTSNGVMKMAAGGSFIVPPGFNNDTFPLMVESGERVHVTPRNQVNNFNNDNSSVAKAIQVLNANLINSIPRMNRPQPLYGRLEGRDIAISNTNASRIEARYNS